MSTSIFPNNTNTVLGSFNFERMKAISKVETIKVVSPVPYFPTAKALKYFKKWSSYSRVKKKDVLEDVEVYYPRVLVIPKICSILNGYLYRLSFDRTLRSIYEDYKFDIIDAHYLWPDSYAAIKFGLKMKVPVCVTAHGSDINIIPKNARIKTRILETLNKADKVFCVSNALREKAKEMGANINKIEVLTNGVDVTIFKRQDRNEARKELGLNIKDKIILCIGSLVPVKDHSLLIDGIYNIKKKNTQKNIKAIFIGDGCLKKSIEKKIKDYNLNGIISLKGSIPHDKLNTWLSAADLLCLTSINEGWPTVLFEAWSCGIPVVSTKAGGVQEALCDEKYGLLINKRTPENVASTIEKALEIKWNRISMIEYAKRNTWEKKVEKVVYEFGKILEGNKN